MLILLIAAAISSGDELFPESGTFAGSFATGIPYLGIGEVAYGVTDRFAIGAVGGATPRTVGAGLRLRGVLFQSESGRDRVVLGAPVLYYPPTGGLGDEPWLLTLPSLLFERRFESGGKIHFGAGIAAASCLDSIGAHLFGSGHSDSAFMGGIWETLTVGGATRMGSFTGFADVTLLFSGPRLAGKDWIGGPPVILTLGVRRGF
jgi:hypothetical protein